LERLVAAGVLAKQGDTPQGGYRLTAAGLDLYGIIVDADGEVVNWNATAGVSKIPKGGHFVGAPMPHWMRLTSGGVGMHAGEIPNPGMPASHGCIRLPAEMAEKLYEVVEVGTPVTITGSAPQG
jgi:lipoprotein-anchoring transpeptidase ErfK/SrfK